MALFFRLSPYEELGVLGGVSSAAVVVITTAGTSQLLAQQGSESLPLIYLLLAVSSIPLASTLCGMLGRRTVLHIYRYVCLTAATAAAALQTALVLEVPGAAIAACVSAYASEIVFDTMYWLVIGEYVATGNLKRQGPRLALFFATGGALGGALTSTFCTIFPPVYGMCLAVVIFPLCYLQCARLSRCLQPLAGSAASEDEPGMLEALRSAVNVCRAFPISGLLAVAVALMSALYCLQDYLSMTIFSARFDEEDVLAQFIGLLFAAQQAAEILVLAVVGRLVLDRTGPLTRNLLFPLATLATLLALLLSPSIAVAVVVSVNANSLSNGLFEPVKSMNYAAIPYKARSSVRVLVEGIVYPSGIGLSGISLFFLQNAVPFETMVSIGAGICGLFLAASAAIGMMFVSSLIEGIRVRAVKIRRHPRPDLKKLLLIAEATGVLQHPDGRVRHDVQLLSQDILATGRARGATRRTFLRQDMRRARFTRQAGPNVTNGLSPVMQRLRQDGGAVPAAVVRHALSSPRSLFRKLLPAAKGQDLASGPQGIKRWRFGCRFVLSPPAYRVARWRLRSLYQQAKLNVAAAAVVKEIIQEEGRLQHTLPVLEMFDKDQREILRRALSVQASVEGRRDVLVLGNLLERGGTQERSEAAEALTSLPSGSLIKPLLALFERSVDFSARLPRDGSVGKSSAAARDAVLWEATQGNSFARLLIAPLLQNIKPIRNNTEDHIMLDIIIFLTSINLFEGLTFESISRAALSAETVSVKKGEWLRSSAVRSSEVVVLRSGRVDLYVDGCAVDTLRPGGFIGASVFCGGDEQELAARAVCDCLLLEFPGSVIEDLCAENPWMLRHVLREVIRMQRKAYGQVAAARRGEALPYDGEAAVLPQELLSPLRRA